MDAQNLKNYRRVQSCANCKHVYDWGIDEEVLYCIIKMKNAQDYKEEINVCHDYICDDYKDEEL